MTRPDWLPVLRRAAAIVTDGGGITCHAAIVGRELGRPVVVGTRDATTTLIDGTVVTVDGDAGTISEGGVALPRAPSIPRPASRPLRAVAGMPGRNRQRPRSTSISQHPTPPNQSRQAMSMGSGSCAQSS